ncbi:MAG: HD domain-containing protein [Gemmatimonadaceae bacterium]|nr:HD domain-containing protein [Gemmatimonadaceae bacterium]
MSEPVRFLTAFAQSLATMSLYGDGHPQRERVIDGAFGQLQRLLETDPRPRFSFLGADVIHGEVALRELGDWGWGVRLANAGVQRLEFERGTTREEFEAFLEEVLARLTLQAVDSATRNPERRSTIKFGAIGVKGSDEQVRPMEMGPVKTAGLRFSLTEEAEAIRWIHDEVQMTGELPLLDAEGVVRSLSVAMHGDQKIVIPLLQLKEFDQYTTTHSLNVSVLTMALAEWMGMGDREVRAFGVAGLLHDLGKVRIPKEVLTKPGKLTDEEWTIMRRHPVDGAKIIYESDRDLDLAAAVAYEHHIMINGQGYPRRHFDRGVHAASKLVHVCDVYDALRTHRPYREAWESDRVLKNIEQGMGTDFDTEAATAFIAMMRSWDSRLAVVDDQAPLPLGLGMVGSVPGGAPGGAPAEGAAPAAAIAAPATGEPPKGDA